MQADRDQIIREIVGTDDEPGLLDQYFIHAPKAGGGPVIWHCRRCHHVNIIARDLDGDQTNLTLGEMAQAALEHEAEVHDGA